MVKRKEQLNRLDIKDDVIHNKQNKTRQSLFFIIIASFITALLLYFYQDQDESEQSLTYFPDDPLMSFSNAATTLQFKNGASFTVKWQTYSALGSPTYLRQDVSLLFKDGKLTGMLSKWKENTDQISQSKTITDDESGNYEAISVHYAERHYPDDVIKGKEIMSYDHLSVMRDAGGHFSGFKIPTAEDQKAWYTKKWRTMKSKQATLITEAAKKFHFNPDDYYPYPLTYIHVFESEPLPKLNQQTTHRVISQLWEGLYKNYALGVHVSENDIRDPIGSSMPMILYSKKGTDLLVIIQLDSGEMTMLKQVI